MSPRRGNRPARSTVVAIAVAALLAGCSGATSAQPHTPTGPIESGSTVVFVGDSIVRGFGVSASQAWPAEVSSDFDWNGVNLGCDGGGFISPGTCNVPIGERGDEVAALDPDVIVISASRNDLGYELDDVVDAITPAVAALAAAAPDALIVGVSDVWGPTDRPADLDSYNTALAAAVLSNGGEFLSFQDPLRGSSELLKADGVHPNAQGQRLIADAFERAATYAGLVIPDRSSASPSPSSSAIPAGSTVVFVGDSIVRGFGGPASQAWPARVSSAFGWDGVNLGCDGGGFIAPGVCKAPIGERAAEVAALDPDVIVIAASRNDLRAPVGRVTAAIASAVAAIAAASPRARIVGASSVWGPTTRPTDLNEYDAALAAAVGSVGGRFLAYEDPLTPASGLTLPDGIHPDRAGQAAIAAAFEAAATAAGLTP